MKIEGELKKVMGNGMEEENHEEKDLIGLWLFYSYFTHFTHEYGVLMKIFRRPYDPFEMFDFGRMPFRGGFEPFRRPEFRGGDEGRRIPEEFRGGKEGRGRPEEYRPDNRRKPYEEDEFYPKEFRG